MLVDARHREKGKWSYGAFAATNDQDSEHSNRKWKVALAQAGFILDHAEQVAGARWQEERRSTDNPWALQRGPERGLGTAACLVQLLASCHTDSVTAVERSDISRWEVYEDEPQGKHVKKWLFNPQESGSSHWLFKPVRVNPGTGPTAEDFAEVFATRIARALGIPAARTELVTYKGKAGTISENIRPKDYILTAGGTWLDLGFPYAARSAAKIAGTHRARVLPGYGYAHLASSLHAVGTPPSWDGSPEVDGYTLFSGYLLLDAIIANTDRHDSNWAILQPAVAKEGSCDRLAPSFDHGSSLGQQLTDDQRLRILNGAADVDYLSWCSKGKASSFDHGPNPTPTLVDYFLAASRLAQQDQINRWLAQLNSVLSSDALDEILDDYPSMSVVTRKFMRAVVRTNVRRVLNG
ncbi:hypothetical protein F8O07_00640 [Pseudoclavibacter sp. CFCC 13796]|uniref:HipA domain-containing protein n=1 Tax=Pseudoclavibacter sp. CFCC 13796 TaxID=2615179 RepID=UPI001300F605|nr:HipA domain-containing protein [Pseudoclavibacter sp. CFCC 13796]KAB1660535.1 hypothetical protein F8O07_00640 [Pseudoclavibacter sp. CFCC 13796]